MKTQSTIAAALLVLFCSAFAYAQAPTSVRPEIKVISVQEGIVKLIVAGDTHGPVEVSFIDESGVVDSDNIDKQSQGNGFSKKYNVKALAYKPFWMEISADGISVRYKVVKSGDRKRLIPMLAQTTYTYPLVASN